MQNDENKVTLVIKGATDWNCKIEMTKQAAQKVIPVLAMKQPIPMSKASMKETRTHIELIIKIDDYFLDRMKQVFHEHAFQVCVNNN